MCGRNLLSPLPTSLPFPAVVNRSIPPVGGQENVCWLAGVGSEITGDEIFGVTLSVAE